MVSASTSFVLSIPGSPCNPIPYSISSSASSNVGLSFPGSVAGLVANPIVLTLSLAFEVIL